MKLKALLHDMAYRYKAHYKAGVGRGAIATSKIGKSLKLTEGGGGQIMPTTLLIPPMTFKPSYGPSRIYNFNVHLH